MGGLSEELKKIEQDVKALVDISDIVVFRVAAFLEDWEKKNGESTIFAAMSAVVSLALSGKPVIADLSDLDGDEYFRIRNALEGAVFYRGFHMYNLKEEKLFLVVPPGMRAHEWPSLGWQERE